MSASITLTVLNGALAGKRFIFRHPALCTIGRSADCEVRVPNDPEYLDVSRHHCLLDIDPPHLRVSDFGSRNGTFVNGVNIGQRLKANGLEFIPVVDLPEYPLKEGDHIRVGQIIFQVGVGEAEDDASPLEAVIDAMPDGELVGAI
jgi:pSer/pThr/pTyr-binding forkhead associated (FHA) protein